MRERSRKRQQSLTLVRNYEEAGDSAFSQCLYTEAAGQYELALTEACSVDDEVRLCDRIASCLEVTAHPELAQSWWERAAQRGGPQHPQFFYYMGQVIASLWVQLRAPEALDLSLRMRDEAIAVNIAEATHIYNLLAGDLLTQLGRSGEAQNYVNVDEDEWQLQQRVSKWLLPYSYLCQAVISATQGEAEITLGKFRQAIDSRNQYPNATSTANIWQEYSERAKNLGFFALARECGENALLIARERHIGWRTTYTLLNFAHLLFIAGEYEHARNFLHEALAHDTSTPILRVTLSILGIELALAFDDTTLLQRVHSDEVLELGLRSRELRYIAPVAAAYAKVRIKNGQFGLAKKIIERAMGSITQAEYAGDLIALAARYASPECAARARELLDARIRLPSHGVAKAYRALWDAQKHHDDHLGRVFAERAGRAFGRLGWKHYQSQALSIFGEPHQIPEFATHASVSTKSSLHARNVTLTPREREVAELVLAGSSNRAIAQALSISEHTVEAHMTSILNRLGLRSRWQLSDTLLP